MRAIRLQNGNLLVPVRVQAGEIIGDSMKEITPNDPDYKKWLPFVTNEKLKND